MEENPDTDDKITDDGDYASEPELQSQSQPEEPKPMPKPQPDPPRRAGLSERVKTVRRVCAYITITATSIFAFVAILAIWIDLGSDIIWRSFASLAVVGFGSLIVAMVAPLIDKR